MARGGFDIEAVIALKQLRFHSVLPLQSLLSSYLVMHVEAASGRQMA